jgi:hypothetical protein
MCAASDVGLLDGINPLIVFLAAAVTDDMAVDGESGAKPEDG